MKRIISLCCVCLILFMSLSVPARAADISNDYLFPVLDYSTANNSGSNFLYVEDGGSVSFSLTRDMSVYYVEILFNSFYSINSVSATVGSDSYSLSIVKVSDSLYRAFGNIYGRSDSSIDFTFDSASGAWIEFYAVNVSTISTLAYTTTLNGVINYGDSSVSYIKDPSVTTPANAIINFNGSFNETAFVTELVPYQWKKYDFIDIQLMIDTQSIDSISCVMGQLNIPFTVSVVNNSNLATSHYITLRLDLRGLDRTSDDYPMIIITGNLNFEDLSLFAIINASGLVYHADTNSILYFLKEKFNNLDIWISNQTLLLQSEMQDMVVSISMEFTNLKNTINSFKDDIMTNIYAFRDEIWGFRYDLDSWIKNQTSLLESAIRGDTDPGNDFQDQVDQKDQDLEDMAAVMDSVTKPAIQDINVSLDQYVKPVDVQVLASPLTVFLEADLFRTMIIMSILLATVSFTLYGKR